MLSSYYNPVEALNNKDQMLKCSKDPRMIKQDTFSFICVLHPTFLAPTVQLSQGQKTKESALGSLYIENSPNKMVMVIFRYHYMDLKKSFLWYGISTSIKLMCCFKNKPTYAMLIFCKTYTTLINLSPCIKQYQAVILWL